MAQRRREKKAKVEEAEREAASAAELGAEDALARADDEPAPEPTEAADEPAEDADGDEPAEGDEASGEGDDAKAAAGDEPAEGDELAEGDEDAAASQLGSERYVQAGFFAAGMLGAFVIGRAIHGIWSLASNKDWFTRAVPALAAVADDDKSTIGLVIGALVAIVLTFRTYRRPDIRAWTDDVAAELAKVKWPTRKEVWNSTVIVIAASAVATIYLALLDKLWAFITNIVYGDGS